MYLRIVCDTKYPKRGSVPSPPLPSIPLNGKNRQLVTDEPVEFEKYPVEVGDFRRITGHFRGICRRIYLIK
jgi:hypothetical protein